MSKYFKREGSPSYEEMYKAIADIEKRLDEIEEQTMPKLPCYNHVGGSIRTGEELRGSTKLQ